VWWRVVARLKDDGYSAFKEIRRDDFVKLIEIKTRLFPMQRHCNFVAIHVG
jgi:hypothetical protein